MDLLGEVKTDGRTIDQLPVRDRVRLEFGQVLRAIAKTMETETIAGYPAALSINLYDLIEGALEQRVYAYCARAYRDGYDHGLRVGEERYAPRDHGGP